MNTETYSYDGIFRKLPAALDKSGNAFAGVERKVKGQNKNGNNMLLVKTKSRNIAINKDDIMYVESNRRKKEIHMSSGVIEIYSTMDALNCLLGEKFYQCHRGYIVNMAHVLEYTCDSIKISSGEVIYMSKEKYSGFESSYNLYLDRYK